MRFVNLAYCCGFKKHAKTEATQNRTDAGTDPLQTLCGMFAWGVGPELEQYLLSFAQSNSGRYLTDIN